MSPCGQSAKSKIARRWLTLPMCEIISYSCSLPSQLLLSPLHLCGIHLDITPHCRSPPISTLPSPAACRWLDLRVFQRPQNETEAEWSYSLLEPELIRLISQSRLIIKDAWALIQGMLPLRNPSGTPCDPPDVADQCSVVEMVASHEFQATDTPE